MTSIIIFASVFGAIALIGMLFFGSSNVVKTRIDGASGGTSLAEKRANSFAQRRQEKGEAISRAALESLREQEKASQNLGLLPLLSQKIQQAGYSFSSPMFLLGTGLLFIGLSLFLYSNTGNWTISLGGGVTIAAFVPMSFLNMAIKNRQAKFTQGLPDALDLIVRSVKSGLPLNESMQAVATEVSGPVGVEFANIVDRLVWGVTLDEVLEGLFTRMPLAEVNFMRIVLSIQHKSGGNISEALNNLSGVLRARATMKEKISAITSEARASSYIIGALPFVMAGLMSVMTPGYLDPLFHTDIGHKVLFGSGVVFLVGVFTLSRMVQIKQ